MTIQSNTRASCSFYQPYSVNVKINLIAVLSCIAMFILGKRCQSAVSLELHDVQNGNCEKLLQNHWSQIKCISIMYNYFHCYLWCDLLARCFNETGNQPWFYQCSSTFRQTYASPFLITANSEDASSSVIRIRGQRCLPFWTENVYVVSVSRCNCSVDDYESGM